MRASATIIEDDYDAEFRYDREPVGALQGLAPDRVALIGTVSKSLAPAIAAGLDRVPATALGRRSREAKELDDRGSPGLDQLALAALIESGRYDRHLRHMRSGLRRQAPGAHRRPRTACARASSCTASPPDSTPSRAFRKAVDAEVVAGARAGKVDRPVPVERLPHAAVKPVLESSCWASATSPRARSPAGSPPSAIFCATAEASAINLVMLLKARP